MSKEALAKVVQRAISDAAFRRQLNSDPAGALRGFDLSADEVSAVRTGDAGRLSTLGIDQRMSKAFVLGGTAAATRMSQSDLSAGSPSMIDDNSGAGSHTVIPANPKDVGSVDAPGSEAWRAKLPNDPDRVTAADASGNTGGTRSVLAGGDDRIPGRVAPEGTSTVRTGDDYKFTDRVAAEGTSTVRSGDDYKFTDRVAAEGTGTSTVRAGDDYKFTDRVAAQGSVAPVEGSPEASAAQNASAGGGMANYPAHDGLAGPSSVQSARAGDDWARNSAGIADSGRIGTARLDDASGAAVKPNVIHDDPNGFLAANADDSGSVVRANVIHDDPNGFLAANANADVTGGAAGTTDAFIDESESYLTKVGYDTTAASADPSVIHDDPDGFLAANADDNAPDSGHSATEGGPNITP
jgi:hypothetical protein